ncbi:uncharacterized protein [Arachis hypogaea]|uniref:uncharacterized protein n=1 Tax=Arachis hypogaea TaxID=3818 RepID=UPI003B222374
MLLALKEKNKLKFVNGSLTKPNEDDTLFEAWKRCNTYVVSWINLSLSPKISESVVWDNIALDLWKDLKHQYYQGDKYRVVKLQAELFSTRQGDLSYRREDCTTRFLRGLNDQYSTVRSQLMLMNPMPDINAVFPMLIQQERQFGDTQE